MPLSQSYHALIKDAQRLETTHYSKEIFTKPPLSTFNQVGEKVLIDLKRKSIGSKSVSGGAMHDCIRFLSGLDKSKTIILDLAHNRLTIKDMRELAKVMETIPNLYVNLQGNPEISRQISTLNSEILRRIYGDKPTLPETIAPEPAERIHLISDFSAQLNALIANTGRIEKELGEIKAASQQAVEPESSNNPQRSHTFFGSSRVSKEQRKQQRLETLDKLANPEINFSEYKKLMNVVLDGLKKEQALTIAEGLNQLILIIRKHQFNPDYLSAEYLKIFNFIDKISQSNHDYQDVCAKLFRAMDYLIKPLKTFSGDSWVLSWLRQLERQLRYFSQSNENTYFHFCLQNFNIESTNKHKLAQQLADDLLNHPMTWAALERCRDADFVNLVYQHANSRQISAQTKFVLELLVLTRNACAAYEESDTQDQLGQESQAEKLFEQAEAMIQKTVDLINNYCQQHKISMQQCINLCTRMVDEDSDTPISMCFISTLTLEKLQIPRTTIEPSNQLAGNSSADATDARSALLRGIQNGVKLRKANRQQAPAPAAPTAPADPAAQLLDAIQQAIIARGASLANNSDDPESSIDFDDQII